MCLSTQNDFRQIIFDQKNLNNELNRESKINAFNLTLWEVFSRCAVNPPISGELVVLGKVLSDGKGDYKTMTTIVNLLCKQLPNVSTHFIVINEHKDELTAPSRGISHFFRAKDQITQDLINKIEQAALVFCGPVNIPSLKDTMTKLGDRAIAICEYDFKDSNRDHGCNTQVLMGLGENAVGIFIKKIRSDYSWKTLQNSKLKEILFGVENPTDEEINHYQSLHNFFFCYYSCNRVAMIYFTHATLLSDHHNQKSIDICYPAKQKISWLTDMIKNIQKSELKNIKTIKIIDYVKDKKELIIPFAEQGKELRILHVGSLSSRDFKSLVSFSLSIVGCTGDHTLSTTLSCGQIPLYEAHQSHKRPLLANSVNLAGELFSAESPLRKYLNYSVFCQEFELITPLLQAPELAEQAKRLGEVIRTNYCFNTILKGIVNERFYRQQHSDIVSYENRLLLQFNNKELKLIQIKELLEKRLIPKQDNRITTILNNKITALLPSFFSHTLVLTELDPSLYLLYGADGWL